MLSDEVFVREKPSSTSTLATHMYSPPWLIPRGAKVNMTTRGDGLDTVTSTRVSLSMTTPLEFVHMTVGVALSSCSKVTVQVSVSVSPAVEGPVLAMSTTGASGTSGGGAGGGVSTYTGHTGRVGIAHLEHPVL